MERVCGQADIPLNRFVVVASPVSAVSFTESGRTLWSRAGTQETNRTVILKELAANMVLGRSRDPARDQPASVLPNS
jgi:hypothetical protein